MDRRVDPVGDVDAQLAELRAAPRFSLMLRVAKLLCTSGEYVCIVRDLSETGAKLKLFHAMPPEDFFLLELSNGERYPMEMVWQDDGHAGFRFAGPINIHAIIDEPGPHPRRPVRLRVTASATISVDGHEAPARLVNMSQQGACIELGSQLAVRQRIVLDVPGTPARLGHVRWRKGFTHGLVFQQGLRLDEFALHAFMLQPFAQAPESSGGKRKVALRSA